MIVQVAAAVSLFCCCVTRSLDRFDLITLAKLAQGPRLLSHGSVGRIPIQREVSYQIQRIVHLLWKADAGRCTLRGRVNSVVRESRNESQSPAIGVTE